MQALVDIPDLDLEQVEIEFEDISQDELAAYAATAPLWAGLPTPFAVLDPDQMSEVGCLDAAMTFERIKAWADAQQARVFARMADRPEPTPIHTGPNHHHQAQEFLRDEVACALHISFPVADQRIRLAQTLLHRLPDTWALLNDGAISYLHCRRLAEATDDCDDTTTTAIETRVLPRAPQQTPAEFARSVQRAVHRLDPRDRSKKNADAAQHRHTRVRMLANGMAEYSIIHTAENIAALATAVQAVADGYPTDDKRTSNQKRADAAVDIANATLNGVTLGDLPTQQGRKPAVQVTISLSTLLYLDEQCADLESPGLTGPIPADIARTIATDLSATWRTLIIDDNGRLLDYGRSVYRPPAALRDFIVARDRTCRIPGCTRPARQADLDHRTRWTDGGHTSPINTHPLCEHDHAAKDEGGWQCAINDDGTTVWTTPLGKRHAKPAETYPQDLTIDKINKINAQDDPPPF